MSHYEELLKAGWSPSSIHAMSMSLSCDVTDDNFVNIENVSENVRGNSNLLGTPPSTPIKSTSASASVRDMNTVIGPVLDRDQCNKENNCHAHKEENEQREQNEQGQWQGLVTRQEEEATRLQEAGWSPSALLCALDSPPSLPVSAPIAAAPVSHTAYGTDIGICYSSTVTTHDRSSINSTDIEHSHCATHKNTNPSLTSEICARSAVSGRRRRDTGMDGANIGSNGTPQSLSRGRVKVQVLRDTPSPQVFDVKRKDMHSTHLAAVGGECRATVPRFVLDLTAESPSPPPPPRTRDPFSHFSGIDSLAAQFSQHIISIGKEEGEDKDEERSMISTASTFRPCPSQLSTTSSLISTRVSSKLLHSSGSNASSPHTDVKCTGGAPSTDNQFSEQAQCPPLHATNSAPASANRSSTVSKANQSQVKNKSSANSSARHTPTTHSLKTETWQKLLDKPLPNGWTLFDYQKDSIMQCLRNERVILALDMGLGKTIISVMWAKAMCTSYTQGCCVAVVVSPCTLMETWRRESQMMGFTCLSNAGTSGSSFEFDKHNLISQGSINNGSVTAENIETAPMSPLLLLQVSWAKIPSPNELSDAVVRFNKINNIRTSGTKFVLVCDEAHAMQSLTSQRTQAALRLCSHSACVGTILATGTPMKNGRPVNLLPLLTAIRHPLASNKVSFERRYCNARKTKFCPWDTSGASNLVELQQLLGGKIIRKTKEECLDLPPLIRRRVVMPVSREVLSDYQAVIQKFKAQSKQHDDGGGSSGLEMVSALRKLTSVAKVSYTANIIRKLLTEDSQAPVVVFVWYRDTARLLEEALQGGERSKKDGEAIRCRVITGDILKQSVRQEIVDSFQAGSLDVVVCSYGVGATGLTLTRSHRLILLDRPWTPGDARQAEDRVRRIGQTATSIHSLWIAGFSIDDSLDAMLQKKDKNCETVISGDLHQSPAEWFQKTSQQSVSSIDKKAQDSKTQQSTLNSYFSTSNKSASRENKGKNNSGKATEQHKSKSSTYNCNDKNTPATGMGDSFVWSSTDREEVEVEGSGRDTASALGKEASASVMKTLLRALLK